MNRRKILPLTLLLFCCSSLIAQKHDFKKIDDWLAGNVKQMGGRDMLVIYKNGQVIYAHAESNRTMRQKMLDKFVARRQGKPVEMGDYTSDSRQAIASCSKWLSAALVMTFVDEGKLKLADTVGKYLPVLSQHGKGNITIGECLSHLTAINVPPLKDDLKEMKGITTMDDAIKLIAGMPVEGEHGKVFHYSSAGLQIAGAILEKISGKSFEELFHERIAKPLNMVNTDFGHGKVALPAGGAYSTPNDYMNFLVMILNKGMFNSKRILNEAGINAMQVNRLTPGVRIAYTPAQVKLVGYGYGEWIMTEGVVSSPGLFGSFPWVDNNHHYAAFLMTYYLNSTGRDQRFNDLMQLVNEAVGN